MTISNWLLHCKRRLGRRMTRLRWITASKICIILHIIIYLSNQPDAKWFRKDIWYFSLFSQRLWIRAFLILVKTKQRVTRLRTRKVLLATVKETSSLLFVVSKFFTFSGILIAPSCNEIIYRKIIILKFCTGHSCFKIILITILSPRIISMITTIRKSKRPAN